MPHIGRILDSTTMWQTLKNLFEQQNGTKRLHFKTKFTNLQLEEGKSVIDFSEAIERHHQLIG